MLESLRLTELGVREIVRPPWWLAWPSLPPPDWSSQFPRSLNVKLKVNKNNFDLLTDNVSCQLIQYKPPKCFGLDFKIKININSILEVS